MHGGACGVPTCILCCFNVAIHAHAFAQWYRMNLTPPLKMDPSQFGSNQAAAAATFSLSRRRGWASVTHQTPSPTPPWGCYGWMGGWPSGGRPIPRVRSRLLLRPLRTRDGGGMCSSKVEIAGLHAIGVQLDFVPPGRLQATRPVF